MSRSPEKFGPEWLTAHLAALLPGYPDVSLCVALSGGVDSTALLSALARATRPPASLRALHVDHGLRPASQQWAMECRRLARRLGVPLKVLTTKVVRTPGESLEARAREARYRLLANELRPAEILLTAQHCDDQLETVLLQLLRGSGLPGLAGMPALVPFASGWLARPLLSRSRAELEGWARSEGLGWVEDDSNLDESLDRNYLRQRILPLLRDRWPGAARAVARSARHAAEAQTLLDALARTDVERASYGESLSVKTLRALPLNRRRNAVRFWITRAGYLAPDSRRLEEIAGPLLSARADANPFVEWGASVAEPRAAHAADGRQWSDEGRRGRQRAQRPIQKGQRAESSHKISGGLRGDFFQRARRSSPMGARVQRDGDLLSLHASASARRGRQAALGSGASARAGSPPAQGFGATRPNADATSPASSVVGDNADPTTAPVDLLWLWRTSPRFELPQNLGSLELVPDPRGPIDLELFPEPLSIRWRGGGERLAPRRGGPRRTLKNLLQEARVPMTERARLPLVFSHPASAGEVKPGEVKLIAVADLLLDQSVQATTATRRRARLRWVRV